MEMYGRKCRIGAEIVQHFHDELGVFYPLRAAVDNATVGLTTARVIRRLGGGLFRSLLATAGLRHGCVVMKFEHD